VGSTPSSGTSFPRDAAVANLLVFPAGGFFRKKNTMLN
jgi:hypothetical protein